MSQSWKVKCLEPCPGDVRTGIPKHHGWCSKLDHLCQDCAEWTGRLEKPESGIQNRNVNGNRMQNRNRKRKRKRNSNVKGNRYKNRNIIILILLQFIQKIRKLVWYHAPPWISLYYSNEKVKKAASKISKAAALGVHRTFCQFLHRLCTTTTWNDQILSSLENVNGRR